MQLQDNVEVCGMNTEGLWCGESQHTDLSVLKVCVVELVDIKKTQGLNSKITSGRNNPAGDESSVFDDIDDRGTSMDYGKTKAESAKDKALFISSDATMPKPKRKTTTKRPWSPTAENPVEEPVQEIEVNAESDVAGPSKKARVYIKLSDDEEQLMVEFIQVNECLYNKKLRSWTDKHMKAKLWADQASRMEKTDDELKQWFQSVRTRLGKLRRWKSGQADMNMSQRDQWIYDSFSFLCPHIVEVQRRNIVSLKAKIAAAAGSGSSKSATTEEPPLPSTSERTEDIAPIDLQLVEEATPITPLAAMPVTPASSSTFTQTSCGKPKSGSKMSTLDDRASRILAAAEQLVNQRREVMTADESERASFTSWAAAVLKNLPKPVYRHAKLKIQELLNDCLDRAEALEMQQQEQPPPMQ